MPSSNIKIRARKHALQTIASRKISLSAFDDERFVQDDGVTCFPFGHFEVRDLAVLRQIAADDGSGKLDEPEPDTQSRNAENSPSWSQGAYDFKVFRLT